MRIAIFSPLNPIKSGISDFTEELVPALSEYMQVDLFVDGIKPINDEILKNYNVYRIEDMDKQGVRERYDHLIFHVGNSAARHQRIVEYLHKYGGVLELHDYALHHYAAETTAMENGGERYIELMRYCHGEKGVNKAEAYLDGTCPPPWEDCPLEYPVNKRILDCANAVIVHSDYIKQLLKGIDPAYKTVCIPLHVNEIIDDIRAFRDGFRQSLGIGVNTLMLASFGFATKPKRILQILEALAELKKSTSDFKYYIVGHMEDDDILQSIAQHSLNKHVVTTGFVDLPTLKRYMGAVDIALNLRYPTHGESSGSLHRLLGMGKTVLVSKVGAFDEYPDDIVIKIRVDENEIKDITNNLIALSRDRQALMDRGKTVLQYAKDNFSLEKNAMKYAEFLQSLSENRYSETEYADHLLDRMLGIEIIDREYAKTLGKRAFDLTGIL